MCLFGTQQPQERTGQDGRGQDIYLQLHITASSQCWPQLALQAPLCFSFPATHCPLSLHSIWLLDCGIVLPQRPAQFDISPSLCLLRCVSPSTALFTVGENSPLLPPSPPQQPLQKEIWVHCSFHHPPSSPLKR